VPPAIESGPTPKNEGPASQSEKEVTTLPDLPSGFVVASGIVVVCVLVATSVIFQPSATHARLVADQDARIAHGRALNAGIEQGRVIRRRGREEVNVRFVNRTEQALRSVVTIRCVALSQAGQIVGEGRSRFRMNEIGVIEPGDARRFVVPIDELDEASHSVSCSAQYSA
jgi:hypothetical protein